MKSANYWIKKLKLQEHPEGGFFKEVYRSCEIIKKSALPQRFSGDRAFSTSIYFLLNKTNFSAFHKIKQDELWHFYDGSSLTIHIINQKSAYFTKKIGKDLDHNQYPQTIIKAGCLFAAEVDNKQSFSLVGCTVAPAFDFADFDIPKQSELIALMPQYTKIIKKFTN